MQYPLVMLINHTQTTFTTHMAQQHLYQLSGIRRRASRTTPNLSRMHAFTLALGIECLSMKLHWDYGIVEYEQMRIGNIYGRDLLVLGLQVSEFGQVIWDHGYIMLIVRNSLEIERKVVGLAPMAPMSWVWYLVSPVLWQFGSSKGNL